MGGRVVRDVIFLFEHVITQPIHTIGEKIFQQKKEREISPYTATVPKQPVTITLTL